MKTVSRRGRVRILSYLSALFLVLGIGWMVSASRAETAKRQLEVGYLRAVENLNEAMIGISNTLVKGKYANSLPMLESLSDRLKADTQTAKESLSELPFGSLHLQNTYNFLSQLGEYAASLTKKVALGGALTDTDIENMAKLETYCTALQAEVRLLEDAVQTGTITFDRLMKDLEQSEVGTQSAPIVTDGFQEFEAGFSEFPSLIYDGPFSDHLTQKEPLMTRDQQTVTVAEAQEVAARMIGRLTAELSPTGEEAGQMPAYLFSVEQQTVAVTKAGGYPIYSLNSRLVEESTLSQAEAVARAAEYLKGLSFHSMKETYYECYGNILTVNFAATQNGVTLYPDLIKVSVAMDNGEILGFDGRGYLVNHTARRFPAATLTVAEAKQKLNPNLTVARQGLAIIPSDAQAEKLCYEFLCDGNDGEQVLVYLNVETGIEEEILILLIDENGTLAF